jgi:Fe-S-cluster containining protein
MRPVEGGFAGNRVSEDGIQSSSMVPVHTYYMISLFATKSRKNILTPYDIVRIKKRLGLTADMFLQLYTTPEILGQTELPIARLKMLEEEGGRCPFVSTKGCQIYSDRPVCCRYYPLGITSLRQQEKHTGEEEEFFFVVREDHCKEFKVPTEWTVESCGKLQDAID